jgi:hypothetical protein
LCVKNLPPKMNKDKIKETAKMKNRVILLISQCSYCMCCSSSSSIAKPACYKFLKWKYSVNIPYISNIQYVQCQRLYNVHPCILNPFHPYSIYSVVLNTYLSKHAKWMLTTVQLRYVSVQILWVTSLHSFNYFIFQISLGPTQTGTRCGIAARFFSF